MKSKSKNLILIGLAIVIVVAFAYMISPKDVLAASVAKDVMRDKARFSPTESVDIAMAMKLITHEPPRMLNPPSDIPPLLLYPPSETELARLSGQ